MKSNEPRRQHYVPISYQNGFADPDGRIWLYDRNTQKYTNTSPRNVCCEKDIYTIDPEGIQDRRIERQLFSQVDGDGAAAIRIFSRAEPFSNEWIEAFSIFMAFQITRNPVFRSLMVRNYQAYGEEYLRIFFSDVERAKRQFESYQLATGEQISNEVTPESMVEAVVGGDLRVNVTERAFLQHMMQQAVFLAEWIASFEWTVLEAPSASGFILCDCPFVVVPPRGSPESIGLGFPGTTKYFPITKALCLRMGEPDFGFSYERLSREEVRLVNQNIAVNSERFIMGPNRTQLEHVISRSKTEIPDPLSRNMIEPVQRDRDGALYRFNFWPRRTYFYPTR
jgi:hypothetical protein